MLKTRLDEDEVLVQGDRIEMHFKSTSLIWFKAAQIAILENRIERLSEGFEVRSIQTPVDDPKELIFVVEVKKSNPIVLTAGAIAVIIAASAAGILLTVTLLSVYKLTPFGKVVAGGAGLGIVAAGIAAAYMFFKR